MDFFDIFIALLFVSVTIVGKLIDKKLKKSADSTKKIDTEAWKEILDEIPEVDAVLGTAAYDKILDAVDEGPETAAPNIRTAPVLKPPVVPVVARGTDEPCKTDKNRIDPKKLIIYSEIMTPKFRD